MNVACLSATFDGCEKLIGTTRPLGNTDLTFIY